MQNWPFPWECGKLQWRTQLEGRGLVEVKQELERFLDAAYQEQDKNESNPNPRAAPQLNQETDLRDMLEGAEKDLRLIDKWMGFCK